MPRLITSVLGSFLSVYCFALSEQIYASTITYSSRSSPIDLNLLVGEELKVSINQVGSISVGVPPELNYKLKVQVIGNQFWMEPTDEFESTRMVVLAQPYGRIILNIGAAYEGTPSDSISVIFDDSSPKNESQQHYTPMYGFASLTRWVAQQLYSPERLLNSLPGVVRIPVSSDPIDLFRCGNRKPALCAEAVSATPIASWQSPDHYVTAVVISNRLAEPVVLDPREIKGIWRTASFLHATLSPTGFPEDNTVLVLISDLPFSESMHSYF